jgi:hypothetical protein
MEQDLRIGHTILSLAAGHRLDGVPTRPPFLDPNPQTRLVVVALVYGRVITGELELMTPFQLQRNRILFGRARRNTDE